MAAAGKKSSLGGKIFIKLREDILSGKYKDREELRENTLAELYSVSRTPVREALNQLEMEGLVTIVPNKGAYVNRLDRKDIDDIYAIRSLLEGLAARWAAQNITQEQLELLEENVYMADFHMQKEHFSKVFECDTKFHDALYDAANSDILAHTLRSFHQYVRCVRKYALKSSQRAASSIKEHKEIVAAIKAKDPEAAQQAAIDHVQKTVENYSNVDIDSVINKSS